MFLPREIKVEKSFMLPINGEISHAFEIAQKRGARIVNFSKKCSQQKCFEAFHLLTFVLTSEKASARYTVE